MAITLDGSDNKIAIGANATGSSFLRLYEDTDNGSNYIDVIAPSAVGSNRVLTLPDETTTLVGTDASQTLTNKTLGSGLVMSASALTLGTAKNATGTAVQFTGIPSWVKRITVMFNEVSTSSSSLVQIQLGDSGGYETSGYTGTAWLANTVNSAMSAGFLITATTTNAYIWNGSVILTHFGSNTWILQGSVGLSSVAAGGAQNGKKTLSDVLTQLQITTVNGTDTFDAGTFNIMYE